nr:ABC transporter A family member 11-like [Coffea arabica]
MELLSGFSLLLQQINALLRKNFILAWRNRRSTFLQLFSSFFFIAFMFALRKTNNYTESRPNFSAKVRDPKPITNPPIPACEDKLIINVPCFDFVWSGSGNQRLESIVNGIITNNPGRTIRQSKVKSFRTKDELDKWLLDNPMRCPGALHLFERNAEEIRYGIEINSSSSFEFGRQIEDPVFKFQVPLQYAVSREISRSLIGDPNFSFNVGLKEFAHPPRRIDSSDSYDGNPFAETIFYLLVAMFGFTYRIHSLVLEKELKLRQTMSIMGLYDSAYWTSWFIWEGFMAFLTSLLIVAFGTMFRDDVFMKNNIFLVFLLFFLFMISMVSFAFMISTLLSKSSSATTVGFFILAFGLVTIFSSLFYDGTVKNSNYRILWSFFPPNPFAGGFTVLEEAAREGGIRWSQRAECKLLGDPCVSMVYFYLWLVSLFFFWSLVAIYFDNIVPNSAGLRKSRLYFLKPSYWTGRGDSNLTEDIRHLASRSPTQPDHFTPDDEDVHEEEASVKKATIEGTVDPDVAVQLRSLTKSYSMALKIRCHRFCFCYFCCTCKITKPFVAVKDLWMNFPKNQLFCLLGPNGAGKSTLISCLTGITPVTHGDAIIYGNSIRSSKGMSTIRRLVGVCAQFDSLWNALSAKEHLHLFASIKGLPTATRKSEVKRLLADVDIDKIANVRAGSYSGGTRRRLSLAIALIGDPKLLILDEPTTGMDPVTRRRIWNVIENAKQGRSIILTTHSMVEADVLSDRIGIMAKGMLRCIGISIVLKSRFGSGYAAKVTFPKSLYNILSRENDINAKHREAVKLFFQQRLNVEPKVENECMLTFTLPSAEEEILARFFSELEKRESEFGIKSIQIGLGTLEEVFLNIAKKAALQTFNPKENMKTLTLPSGATLQVPLGAEYVKIPGTESRQNPRGLMVDIFWAQDDTGNLCISGHSAEKPVPPDLQLTAASSVTSTRKSCSC